MLTCVTSNRQVFLKAFDFASQQQLKGIGSVDNVQNVLYSLSGKKGKKRERANQNLDPSGGECKDHTLGACHTSFCKIAECVERTKNTCSFLGQGQGLATILKDTFLSRAL
jgi:hypothetical protein